MRNFVALVAAALSPFLLVPAAPAQTYTWSLFAGQPPQFGSVDGPAASARFKLPAGVAGDADNNLYVADTYNHTIRKIAPDGSATILAGKPLEAGTADGPGAAARFNFPYGMAIDRTGNLYVADRGNHAVRRITPAGSVTTFAGRTGTLGAADGSALEARFNAPHGLAFDHDGNLVVADLGNHSVRLVTPAGNVETIAGTSGPSGYADGVGRAARFFFPNDVAVDRAGNIFVADTSNQVIRRIGRDRTVSTFAGMRATAGSADGTGAAARFSNPMGLAIDVNDNLFVADRFNDCIRRITPEGVVTVFAGRRDLRGSANGPGATAQFFEPSDVHLSGEGSIYVADTKNHTIRKISPSHTVSDHSGPGGGFGYVEGTGPNARFNYPHGIAFAGDRLYVTDARNNRIRQVTTDGVVTSLLSGSYSGIAFGGDTLVVSNDASHAVRIYSLSAASYIELSQATVGGGAIFNQPGGLAVDRQGRIYVADTANHIIRVIILSPGKIDLNTVAGSMGVAGSENGRGTAARFNAPLGVAVDSADNVYVADAGSHTIRRIAADGTVTTLAGRPGEPRLLDGTGAAARFNIPTGIAVDGVGNVFVTDRGNHAIRRITPGGVVTTLSGSGSGGIYAEGKGTAAAFSEPNGIAVDSEGALYVVSSNNNVIMKGVPHHVPVIATSPQATAVPMGSATTLAVTASGGDLRYQWQLNGVAIAGATGRTYTIANAAPSHAGRYTVEVSNVAGRIVSAPAEVTVQSVPAVSRIINLAIRSSAGTGDQTLIVGIGIGGAGTAGTQPILVRAVGPTLREFGVEGVLPDPRLELFSGRVKIGENDNWADDNLVAAVSERVGAFKLSSAKSRDAALFLPAVAAGTYSVQVTGSPAAVGADTSSGVALVEIYDATPSGSATAATARLINVSARAQIGEGARLFAGFVIAGPVPKNVLIRAVGPTLRRFGLQDALADPKLELFDGTGKIAENDDWGGGALLASNANSVGAFPLEADTRDAVLLARLQPGAYTVQIGGGNQSAGVVLVEIYDAL